MKAKINLTANARWTTDCQGKEDLDFPLISCFTRYWPDHSAMCEIVFLHNFCENAKTGEDPYVKSDVEPKILAESEIMHAKNKQQIRRKVRNWYNSHVIEAMDMALKIIKGEK